MKIILGITGSVATVLAPKLAAQLVAAGHEIEVVATTPALYFLKPEQFDSGHMMIKFDGQDVARVFVDKDEWPAGGYHKGDPVEHIKFRDNADLLLIAPLSANTLAKIANGICDNFLTCIARAWKKETRPFVIAPAMNTMMWEDLITVQQLKALDIRFLQLNIVAPEKKMLACGDEGVGAMADISEILRVVDELK